MSPKGRLAENYALFGGPTDAFEVTLTPSRSPRATRLSNEPSSQAPRSRKALAFVASFANRSTFCGLTSETINVHPIARREYPNRLKFSTAVRTIAIILGVIAALALAGFVTQVEHHKPAFCETGDCPTSDCP